MGKTVKFKPVPKQQETNSPQQGSTDPTFRAMSQDGRNAHGVTSALDGGNNAARKTAEGVEYSFEDGKLKMSAEFNNEDAKGMLRFEYVNHLLPTYKVGKKHKQVFLEDDPKGYVRSINYDKYDFSYRGEDGMWHSGGTASYDGNDVWDRERSALKGLIAKQCIYNDLQKRGVDTLSDTEKLFMRVHEELLEERGLMVTRDGILEYKDCPENMYYNNQKLYHYVNGKKTPFNRPKIYGDIIGYVPATTTIETTTTNGTRVTQGKLVDGVGYVPETTTTETREVTRTIVLKRLREQNTQ